MQQGSRWALTPTGKQEARDCVVTVSGASLTVDESGGVGDVIEWDVTSIDSSGNTVRTTCVINVNHP